METHSEDAGNVSGKEEGMKKSIPGKEEAKETLSAGTTGGWSVCLSEPKTSDQNLRSLGGHFGEYGTVRESLFSHNSSFSSGSAPTTNALEPSCTACL